MPNSALIRLPKRRASELEAVQAVVVPAEPVPQLDFRELGRKLWRRKAAILGTAAALMALAVLIVFQLTPIYRASALVMIDARQPNVVRIEKVLSALTPDDETVRSEIQVIKSRQLARRTIEKSGLDRDPEFAAAALAEPWAKWFDLRNYLPAEWAAVFVGPAEDEAVTASDRRDAEQTRLVDRFLDRLTVVPEPHSRVIRISFDSKNPRMAASVANTLVDFYLVSQIEAKFDATKRANLWLSEHLAILRDQVGASERAVEAYRKESGLLRGTPEGGKDTTIAAQEISQINAELVRAQSDRAAAEAKLGQLTKVLTSTAGSETITDVLHSPLIQKLREQQAEVERRAAELSAQYGDAYPAIVSARAEIHGLQKKIANEIEKIVQSLRNDVLVARAREATLTERLNESKGQIARLDEANVHLRALEREAAANRSLYDNFLDRFKETSSQSDDLQHPDARIISRADVPQKPFFPNKWLAFSVAFIWAMTAGFGLAFLLERLDHGFRSMDQIEDAFDVPALGLVPALKRLGPRRSRKSRLNVIERADTTFAEAVRGFTTKLFLLDVERAPRTVLITSSVPHEGKTTLALSFAVVQARLGRKVVFVDCDLRKPAAHLALGVPVKPGLVELLSGAASLEEALSKNEDVGISAIPAGGTTSDPAGLLASEAMATLLRTLAQSHDLVVLDSAPALVVSDTLALCRHADKTVFLVRWAETRRTVAVRGLRALVDAGAQVAGVLLSRVDIKKHAAYGYGDSGFYYGRVRDYYSPSSR